jgi:steroid delta-isomerase-like uncharacterized protein
MAGEQHVDVVRWIYDAINADDGAALGELLAADMVRHDLTDVIANSEGGAEVTNFLHMLREAMPDLHMKLEDAFESDGGRVAARVTLSGTHTGPFLGAEPGGKHVSFAAITLYRIEDGRAREAWSLVDWAGALRQMATIPG